MRNEIDVSKSKAQNRLRRKISPIDLIEIIPRILFVTIWIISFPIMLGSMYFNAFHDNQIVEILFFLSILVSGLLLYASLTINRLIRIHGLTVEKNQIISEEIARKLDWKADRKKLVMNVFYLKWSWFSTHYGRDLTVIYDGSDVLINSTTFLLYDLKSPFHWFGNRKVEKLFTTEFEKEKKQRHANNYYQNRA